MSMGNNMISQIYQLIYLPKCIVKVRVRVGSKIENFSSPHLPVPAYPYVLHLILHKLLEIFCFSYYCLYFKKIPKTKFSVLLEQELKIWAMQRYPSWRSPLIYPAVSNWVIYTVMLSYANNYYFFAQSLPLPLDLICLQF